MKDVAERKYLQVCLAAVEREARLEAAAVTATDYWWSTTWKPAGPRLWRKLDAETWQETDPSGAMKIFSIVALRIERSKLKRNTSLSFRRGSG